MDLRCAFTHLIVSGSASLNQISQNCSYLRENEAGIVAFWQAILCRYPLLILSGTGQTLFPRVQLMLNLDHLPIRVTPISGLFSSSFSQLHFQSFFSVYVGRFGFTPFLVDETCLLNFDALTLTWSYLYFLYGCLTQGGVKALIPYSFLTRLVSQKRTAPCIL